MLEVSVNPVQLGNMTLRLRASASQHFGRRADESDDSDEEHRVRYVLEHAHEERFVRGGDDEGEQNRDDAEREQQPSHRAELPDVGGDGCEQQHVGNRRPQNGGVARQDCDACSGNVRAKTSVRVATHGLTNAREVVQVEGSCAH